MTKNTGIGFRHVNTPLKALLTSFLRSNEIKATTAARNTPNKILDTIPGTELTKYEGERGDTVKSGLFPTEQQIENALSIWFEYCKEDRKILYSIEKYLAERLLNNFLKRLDA